VRLKFKRDTAFKAAIAGLARVRELELRQQELRERGIEMLRQGLKTLDELDKAENKDRLEGERPEGVEAAPASPGAVDLAAVLGLSDFDLDPAFWASLDFGGRTPQASQGT
jgi:hypothetical protein